jgi:hypothetical protein
MRRKLTIKPKLQKPEPPHYAGMFGLAGALALGSNNEEDSDVPAKPLHR